MKKRALISVTNKDGLEKLGRLHSTGNWEFVSTGGTGTALTKHGIPYLEVGKVTGFPEMMDGRLKTMHPKLMGGILANRSVQKHLDEAAEHAIEMCDLVVVNLYDFHGKAHVENIDIGGPTLLRAAAKNAHSVAVVMDPNYYDRVIDEILEHGEVSADLREMFATEVFLATSIFDRAIYEWSITEIDAGRDPFGIRNPTPSKITH